MHRDPIFVDNSVFKKGLHVESIKTQDGFIIHFSNLENENIYYLDNEISSKIWELIDGKNSLRQIENDILLRYEIDNQIARQDLEEFLKQLYDKELISI